MRRHLLIGQYAEVPGKPVLAPAGRVSSNLEPV